MNINAPFRFSMTLCWLYGQVYIYRFTDQINVLVSISCRGSPCLSLPALLKSGHFLTLYFLTLHFQAGMVECVKVWNHFEAFRSHGFFHAYLPAPPACCSWHSDLSSRWRSHWSLSTGPQSVLSIWMNRMADQCSKRHAEFSGRLDSNGSKAELYTNPKPEPGYFFFRFFPSQLNPTTWICSPLVFCAHFVSLVLASMDSLLSFLLQWF